MATTITIVNLNPANDAITGQPSMRAGTVIVSDSVSGSSWLVRVGSVPLVGDAQTYLNGIANDLLSTAQQLGIPLNTQQLWQYQQSPLVAYYSSIILSLYNDVDNVAVTLTQLLTNAAAIVATNATQASKFNAYRTRLGLGGAIGSLTPTQQGNLLVLGLEWAAAGLAVALSIK